MARPVEFNPRLLEMAKKLAPCEPATRDLILAFLPYLGAPLAGPDVSRKARELVTAGLRFFEPIVGPWTLAWGPGVFQVLPDAIPANTMFVAEHDGSGELFISIAGTNPFSAYAWFVEDFQVSETRAWSYGNAPDGAAVSRGTMNGLRALQGMVPLDGIPGGNLTLERFLTSRFHREGGPVEITVSGHSLGGALSPTLALWLLDSKSEWDPHDRARICVYAYAGPTPGNDRFTSYINERFGDRLHRITNPLDVVTHAWNIGDLAELKALYTPLIPRDALWDKAVDATIAATNGINYTQIDRSPLLLDGKVREDLIWRWAPRLVNLTAQVLYQHTLAYFVLLGLDYPEQHASLGRHLAAQTGDVAKQLFSRCGLPPVVAVTLASALRLIAETYSRMPLLPSPLPETKAI